jgi:GNAT superfamily N-acetyltransferase
MTSDVFDAWSAEAVAGFARQLVDSGSMPVDEASAYAADQRAHVLPDGIATPLHHFWTALLDDQPVGHLWLCVRPRGPDVESFVYDVAVAEVARGRGIGRAVMLAGESAARELGATVMRLNVFGHNRPAMRLYDRLGYVVESAVVRLGVDPDGDDRGHGGDVVLSHVAGDDLRAVRTGSGGTTLVLTAQVAGQAAGWFSFRLTAPADGPRALVQHHGVGDVLDPAAARGLVLELRRLAREHAVRHLEISLPGIDAALRAACDEQGAELAGQLMRKPL